MGTSISLRRCKPSMMRKCVSGNLANDGRGSTSLKIKKRESGQSLIRGTKRKTNRDLTLRERPLLRAGLQCDQVAFLRHRFLERPLLTRESWSEVHGACPQTS